MYDEGERKREKTFNTMHILFVNVILNNVKAAKKVTRIFLFEIDAKTEHIFHFLV